MIAKNADDEASHSGHVLDLDVKLWIKHFDEHVNFLVRDQVESAKRQQPFELLNGIDSVQIEW